MKLISLNSSATAHLQGDTVYLYTNSSSEILHIDGIENSKNPKELIRQEFEYLSRASLSSASSGFKDLTC